VRAAIEILQEDGPNLGRPLADKVRGSRIRNLKELRPGSSGRSEIRICSHSTRAGGRSCWYAKAIPRAEELYEEHLRSRGGGG
jgi:hypothetical protein